MTKKNQHLRNPNCQNCPNWCKSCNNSFNYNSPKHALYFYYRCNLSSIIAKINYQTFNLYLQMSKGQIMLLHPDLINKNNKICDDEVIIESTCYVLGKLIENQIINNPDLKKCYEVLSAIDSARKIVDPNSSISQKVFAAQTAFELINKYV